MVCLKVEIVNVDSAIGLHHLSLNQIKATYPKDAQLFHFLKTARFHVVSNSSIHHSDTQQLVRPVTMTSTDSSLQTGRCHSLPSSTWCAPHAMEEFWNPLFQQVLCNGNVAACDAYEQAVLSRTKALLVAYLSDDVLLTELASQLLQVQSMETLYVILAPLALLVPVTFRDEILSLCHQARLDALDGSATETIFDADDYGGFSKCFVPRPGCNASIENVVEHLLSMLHIVECTVTAVRLNVPLSRYTAFCVNRTSGALYEVVFDSVMQTIDDAKIIFVLKIVRLHHRRLWCNLCMQDAAICTHANSNLSVNLQLAYLLSSASSCPRLPAAYDMAGLALSFASRFDV